MFRKMGHWYLKGMRVRAVHRHQFQIARTIDEFAVALAAVREAGPVGTSRDGRLPDLQVPVPSGPIALW